MTKHSLRALFVGVAACLVAGINAPAGARPPDNGSSGRPAALNAVPGSGPLIGRVRIRGRVIDLTRASLAEGGPAHEMASGVANLADINRVDLRRREVSDPRRR